MKLNAARILVLGLLLIGSASAEVQLLSNLTSEAALAPGGRREGRILLQNTGGAAATVRVYQTDYLFHCDGANYYDTPGSSTRSNCSWITFSPQQFDIPPKETLAVRYALQVPNDQKLSGTYWSMLMVEPIANETNAPLEAEDGHIQVGLRTVIRYGIQIVTNIGDTGRREIKVADKKLVTNDGKRLLQLDVQNTGERWLRPVVWAEVYDEKGEYVGRFGGARTRIYPGCSTRNLIDLSALRAGKYNALVVVDNQDESVWGARYVLQIE